MEDTHLHPSLSLCFQSIVVSKYFYSSQNKSKYSTSSQGCALEPCNQGPQKTDICILGVCLIPAA